MLTAEGADRLARRLLLVDPLAPQLPALCLFRFMYPLCSLGGLARGVYVMLTVSIRDPLDLVLMPGDLLSTSIRFAKIRERCVYLGVHTQREREIDRVACSVCSLDHLALDLVGCGSLQT